MPKILSKQFLFLIFLLAFSPLFSHAQTLININTAGSTELQALKGIGPAKAQTIIDYRNANGPFLVIDDIKKVSGIGDVTFSNIKDFITVGSTSTPVLEENTQNTETSPPPSPPQTTSSSATSAHYSSDILSNKDHETVFELSAGRDRLGSTGSPLEFKVESNISYFKNSTFKWNFGDGSESEGSVVVHTYEYPGDYVVVLNANVVGQGQAVSRTEVKIVDPKFSLELVNPERIEIKNNSKSEASLFGRALWAEGRSFLFPKDTIVKAGQTLSFSSRLTGLYPNSIYEVQLMDVGNTEQARIKDRIEEQRLERISLLQSEIQSLRHQLSLLPKESVVQEEKQTQENQVTEQLPERVSVSATAQNSGWLETLKRFFLRKN